MRKKNLPPHFQNLNLSFDFSISPLSLDHSKKWHIRACRRRICRTVPIIQNFEQRIFEAKEILFNLEKEFLEPTEKEKYFSKDVNTLYTCLKAKKDIRKKTFETYQSILTNLDSYCKQYKINMLGRVDAINFLNELHKKKKSNVTINKHLVTLRFLYSFAKSEKLLKNNPFKKFEFETQLKKLPNFSKGKKYFHTQQSKLILQNIDDDILMLGVKLLYYCFIRPGEARFIKIKHLDFDEMKICVPSDISKNKKTQFIKIPKPLFVELHKFKNEPLDNYILGGLDVPIAQNYLYRKHDKILKSLGFSSEYSLYSWKHTGVVRAYRAGVGLKELQTQLRHYNLEMVSIYLASLGIDDIDISGFPAI